MKIYFKPLAHREGREGGCHTRRERGLGANNDLLCHPAKL